jgi:peptidoglycan hydrolase CwlO-like protein
MSKLENNVEELSSNLQKKSGKYSLPEIQSNLKQLSAKVNYDFNELSNASTNFFTNAEADNLKNEVLKIKNTAQNKLSSLDNDITNVRSTIDESKKTIQQLSVDFNIASNVVENKI